MQKSYSTIISAADLELNLDSVCVIDCRADLVNDRYGFDAFKRGRIPGAKFVDLNHDLSGEPGVRGRHPLPDRNNWLETVRSLGIKTNDQIVAYDDVGGMYAARFWWMMRWLGHEKVAILDGGIQQWEGKLECGENSARNTYYYLAFRMLHLFCYATAIRQPFRAFAFIGSVVCLTNVLQNMFYVLYF